MRGLVSVALAIVLGGCGGAEVGGDLPEPVVPEDNPTTAASIELGRHLFYDQRLSVNESISCSSCHRPELAFADDVTLSPGATGELGALNTPTLTNVAYAYPLTWSRADIHSIETQLEGPMFGETPIEMGMRGAEGEIVSRLRNEARYAPLFAAAFGDGSLDGANGDVLDDVRYALASFTRSLVSSDAPFDRYLAGERGALTAAAIRGSELFYSSRLGCGNCHAGFSLTEASRSLATTGRPTNPYHNVGLYNTDGAGAYPDAAPGLIAESGIERDAGRFRVPTLRNVAVTAPYMHDGSVASLEDVIRIYERGGRLIETGDNAGDGADNPFRSEELATFELSTGERADVVAFLESLTDSGFLVDEAHADPW